MVKTFVNIHVVSLAMRTSQVVVGGFYHVDENRCPWITDQQLSQEISILPLWIGWSLTERKR